MGGTDGAGAASNAGSGRTEPRRLREGGGKRRDERGGGSVGGRGRRDLRLREGGQDEGAEESCGCGRGEGEGRTGRRKQHCRRGRREGQDRYSAETTQEGSGQKSLSTITRLRRRGPAKRVSWLLLVLVFLCLLHKHLPVLEVCLC